MNQDKTCDKHLVTSHAKNPALPSDESIRRQADILKALSDPARAKIVYALGDGDLCVCELMRILGVSQTMASHHLKILKYADIISDKKEGKWVYYSLIDRKALDVLKLLETDKS
jgi:ArsR family transcriptional regulator